LKQTLNAPLSSIFPDLPHWAALPLPILKDIRVAAVPAIWGIAILVLGALFFRQPLGINGLTIHAIACSAIAALIAGHDFLYRTASWNMALPVSRGRVWRQRMMIAGMAMLPVIAVAFFMDWFPLFFSGSYVIPMSWRRVGDLFIEPAITALCLAPWLTLVSRSPLFGTVFSTGAMVLVFIISASLFELFGVNEPQQAAATFAQYAMPCIWIFGVVMGWRKFMILEAIEGSAKAGTITRSATTQRVRRTSATWQLFKKEIMLQRFPLGLAALAIGLVFLLKNEHATLWTLVYPVALVVLMASVSSADERQLGTAEWQVVMPMGFWKQWLIKLSTTWTLAFVVGLMLPIAVLFYKTGELQKIENLDSLTAIPILAAGSFLFVAVTMYVSSLCDSGLKAVMAAMLVNVLAAYMIAQSFMGYTNFLWTSGFVTTTEKGQFVFHDGEMTRSPESTEWWTHVEYWPFLISILGAISLALFFAARNHRYAERGLGRVLRQLVGFAVYEFIILGSAFAFWNWYTWLH
jgi:hypothetical protein